MTERLLVVVQRYGDGVSGGAEAHARELVSHLKPHFDIQVATTTALDYWTWNHALTPGDDNVDGVPVKRFQVQAGRAKNFRNYERGAFRPGQTLEDERSFIKEQGPYVPELLEYIHSSRDNFDHTLFFTYIYYPTAYGLLVAPERAVLVPTAHDEPAIGLTMYRALFHAPRAIAYNTEEERQMVHKRFGNQRVPSDIVGVGVDVPTNVSPTRFRERHGIEGPYFLYLGRIVESKGAPELFDHWERWRAASAAPATLVLAGSAEMALPDRADVRHLGRISDEDKFDAIAGAAAVVVPSRLESLSLVTLEAWALGRPTLCSAKSPVLASLSRRAGAGLPYGSFAEFAELCELLIEKPALGDALGRNGAEFVARTYTWPVVVEKYRDLFAEVRTRAA